MGVDLLVETTNPEALDRIVNAFGAALVGGPDGPFLRVRGAYVVRVLGDPGYVRFAIEHLGYGRVVGSQPVAMTEEETSATPE